MLSPVHCGVPTTSLYTVHLLSFWKLSYWSLLYPRRWRCWTSASGRSIPASRLVLLSFYPDQQELKSPKDEETAQEYLMRMMLAPPFGYRDELKLECSKALINPQDILILVVRRWRVYVFYMKFSLSKKKKKVDFYFFMLKWQWYSYNIYDLGSCKAN